MREGIVAVVGRRGCGILLLGSLLTYQNVSAQSSTQPGIEERLTRLERMLSSEVLVELLQKVERLQHEVQELRGEIEVQSHSVKQIEGRQRELYLDIDRRMADLEAKGLPGAAPTLEPATQDTEASIEESDEAPAAAAEEPASASTESSTMPGATQQSTAPSGASLDPIKEQDAYQTAFDLLKSGRYEEASTAFKQFLDDYPGGRYTDNAQYWLGESYYATRKFEPALGEFNRLVLEYPESTKLTHALLKIGYIHDELGNRAEAERVLDDLVKRFPDTRAAQRAKERLQQIRGG